MDINVNEILKNFKEALEKRDEYKGDKYENRTTMTLDKRAVTLLKVISKHYNCTNKDFIETLIIKIYESIIEEDDVK